MEDEITLLVNSVYATLRVVGGAPGIPSGLRRTA
jgi:hypothetical protein